MACLPMAILWLPPADAPPSASASSDVISSVATVLLSFSIALNKTISASVSASAACVVTPTLPANTAAPTRLANSRSRLIRFILPSPHVLKI